MRILALGGAAGPLVFSTVVLVSAALRTDYSHADAFISELGARDAPTATLMNYFGFMPGGLMLAAFGISLAMRLRRRVGARLGAMLVAAFGFGVAVSGAISCDPGCPTGTGSTENLIHNAIGPVAFLCAVAGAAILGLQFRRIAEWQSLWRYSVWSSVLALGLFIALASSVDARHLTGLWQRLFLATVFSWCAVIGIHAFRLSDAGTS
jgi:hypothetical protein